VGDVHRRHDLPAQFAEEIVLGDAVSSVFVAELFAAPFVHLVGLVLGVIALFHAGDRRGLTVVGILLNVIVVAIGLTMAYLAASGLAPR
jgi:hypothetical protein